MAEFWYNNQQFKKKKVHLKALTKESLKEKFEAQEKIAEQNGWKIVEQKESGLESYIVFAIPKVSFFRKHVAFFKGLSAFFLAGICIFFVYFFGDEITSLFQERHSSENYVKHGSSSPENPRNRRVESVKSQILSGSKDKEKLLSNAKNLRTEYLEKARIEESKNNYDLSKKFNLKANAMYYAIKFIKFESEQDKKKFLEILNRAELVENE